ncbi:zinc finger protein 263-like isoform X5 [Anguilla rostrata]|uniref:zinc finger protein 263-like isoform X5 n=1 Tax=Anguilla rostrata TaxID=7938 RepID=UPI0030CC4D41
MVENCGFSVTWKPQPGRWLHPHNQFLLFTIQESIVSGKRFKMTKLEILNAYFTERLMAAAQEIMHLVGETVMEYQEETVRAKRENESLRRRLREAGLDGEAGLTKPVPPLRADRAVSEHQEWGSTGQNTESTLTAVKLEFSEPQRHRQEEEEHLGLESGTDGSVIPSPCSKRECGPDSLNQPAFPPPCGKRDSVQDPQNHLDLRLQIGNTEEEEGTPCVTHYQIKTETGGVDYNPSEQSTEPFPFHAVNLEASELPNRNDMNVFRAEPAGRMSAFEAELSPGALGRIRGQSTHFCPQCGKAFRHMSQVRRHLRMHTGEKPFCCPVCEKCFKYSGNLKEHQIVHTGEKPHRCSVCGRCFGKSAHLQRHLRIHTGEKPYRCPVCERCFTQSGVMKRHLQVHNSFNYT